MAKIEIVTTVKHAKAALQVLMRCEAVGCDTETEGFDRLTQKMCMLQLTDGFTIWLVDLSKVDVQLFKELFESRKIVKIFQNGAFDCTWLMHEHGIKPVNLYDTMLNEKIILGVVIPRIPQEGFTKAKLEALKPMYSSSLSFILKRMNLPDKLEFEEFTFGKKWTDNQVFYSARDVEFLHLIREVQMRKIDQLNLNNVSQLENEVLECFYQMTATGFNLDTKGWKKYADENEIVYKKALDGLAQFADINWGAPGQTCKFFGVKYIAELEALEPTEEQKPAYQYWKDARRVRKWVDTFGNNWLVKHVHNSIVYCDYTQIVNTGRISCDSPNLQNIPVKNGALHRSFFIPRKGNVFCVGDFSGQELAIMAVGSQEPVWLETLRAGKDLHQKCADLMSKVSGEEVPRRMAKTLNFTMGYGGGKTTVVARLKNDYDIVITEDQAQNLINVYFRTFPKLKKWLDGNGQLAIQTGKTFSFPPFNRMRVLALETEDWRKKNIGKNSPVQGTGADMTKLAMVYMFKQLGKLGFMVHQLHDELIIECAKKNAKAVKQLMIDCMNQSCTAILGEPLSQPDVHLLTNWIKPK